MPNLPRVKPTAHIVELERLRRAIPLKAALELLTQSALTGQIPILDLHGKPTGQFKPLRPDKQIDLLQYLVNKSLPDRTEAPMLPEDAETGKVIDVRNLSDDELEALAAAKPVEAISAPAEPEPEPARPSSPGTPAASGDTGITAAQIDSSYRSLHERLQSRVGPQGSGGSPGSVHGSGGTEAEPKAHDLPAAPDGQDAAS